MSLLSSQDKTKIRHAIKLVTDTFMVTPVKLYRKKLSLDIWQENPETQDYTLHTVNGLVEYPETKMSETVSGAEEYFDIKVTFNLEDLETAGLIDPIDFTVPFIASEDYLEVQGIKYRMNFVGYDGPLETKNVLVLITGRKLEKQQ